MNINHVKRKAVPTGRLFMIFMIKLAMLISSLMVATTVQSQSILDEAFLPIYDSNGMVVAYIKKTSLKKYQQPTRVSKIGAYDDELHFIGYWLGTRKKFIKLKTKH